MRSSLLFGTAAAAVMLVTLSGCSMNVNLPSTETEETTRNSSHTRRNNATPTESTTNNSATGTDSSDTTDTGITAQMDTSAKETGSASSEANAIENSMRDIDAAMDGLNANEAQGLE
jgi:hypothetical protein